MTKLNPSWSNFVIRGKEQTLYIEMVSTYEYMHVQVFVDTSWLGYKCHKFVAAWSLNTSTSHYLGMSAQSRRELVLRSLCSRNYCSNTAELEKFTSKIRSVDRLKTNVWCWSLVMAMVAMFGFVMSHAFRTVAEDKVVSDEIVRVQLAHFNPPKHVYVSLRYNGHLFENLHVSKHCNAWRDNVLGTDYNVRMVTYERPDNTKYVRFPNLYKEFC